MAMLRGLICIQRSQFRIMHGSGMARKLHMQYIYIQYMLYNIVIYKYFPYIKCLLDNEIHARNNPAYPRMPLLLHRAMAIANGDWYPIPQSREVSGSVRNGIAFLGLRYQKRGTVSYTGIRCAMCFA